MPAQLSNTSKHIPPKRLLQQHQKQLSQKYTNKNSKPIVNLKSTSETNSVVSENNKITELKSKIEKYKSNMKNIKSTNYNIKTLVLNSLNIKWKGRWKNHIDNKIIIKRELIPTIFNAYNYQLTTNKIKNVSKILIKKIILPKQVSLNNLFIDIDLSNSDSHSKLLYSKTIELGDTYYVYENSEPINLINLKDITKLSININNYNDTHLNISNISVKHMDIEESSKDTYKFIIYINNVHKQVMQCGNTILFGNFKLAEFIKLTKLCNSKSIKLLEHWFNKTSHKVLSINYNPSNKDYIDSIVVATPIKYDILTGVSHKKNKFDFILPKQNTNNEKKWPFKQSLNNVKQTNLGFIINKSIQHIIEMEFHSNVN